MAVVVVENAAPRKQCAKCGDWKGPEDFRKLERNGWCRRCRNDSIRERRRVSEECRCPVCGRESLAIPNLDHVHFTPAGERCWGRLVSLEDWEKPPVLLSSSYEVLRECWDDCVQAGPPALRRLAVALRECLEHDEAPPTQRWDLLRGIQQIQNGAKPTILTALFHDKGGKDA